MKTYLDLLRLSFDLRRQPSLKPSPTTNALFGRLVSTVMRAPGQPILGGLGLAWRLRKLSAEGEAALETHWAKRILEATDPRKELDAFPYGINYRDLVEMELGLLPLQRVRTILFIGGGPLPMTPLLLAERGFDVTIIDSDPEACHLSRDVIRSLGLESHMRVVQADALQVDPAGFDVVMLAALVGGSGHEKCLLIDALLERMDRESLLLARSARGWKTLLYPPVPETPIRAGEAYACAHPTGDVINSAVVFRPRPAAV